MCKLSTDIAESMRRVRHQCRYWWWIFLPYPDLAVISYHIHRITECSGIEDTHKDNQVQLLILMSDWLWANNVLPLQTGQTTHWSMLGLSWRAEQGSYNLHCWVSSSTGIPRNRRRSRGGLPIPGDRTCVLEIESRELEVVWWREVWRGDLIGANK